MSERYWINGVQLGLLNPDGKNNKLVSEIIDKQFITNCWTDQEKRIFKEEMENFKYVDIVKAQKSTKPSKRKGA